MPEGLVEITVRCFQGCFLLRPSPELNDRFLGVLGRAKELYPVLLHAVSVMSNHYHLLMSPGDAEKQANFMGHLNGNLSKEIGRLTTGEAPSSNGASQASPSLKNRTLRSNDSSTC